jgi:hypothetical protein
MSLMSTRRWSLLRLWPYYVDEFKTNLDQNEVIRRLNTLVTPHSLWLPAPYRKLKGKFIGHVTDGAFTMIRLMYFVLEYFPIVRGRILKNNASGVIVRTTYWAPAGYVFLVTNLVFVIVALFSTSPLILLATISIMLCWHVKAGGGFQRELSTTATRLRELLDVDEGLTPSPKR